MQWPASRKKLSDLVDEHYQGLYRYAYRLSGNSNDAEDLTQEAFCNAQLHFHQVKDETRVKSWLFAILRNLYLKRLRDDKAWNKAICLEAVGDVPESIDEPWPEIDGDKLQKALNDLPEQFRSPVILFYFEEFSYREISEQLNVPIGTVMSRLARAKAFLRSRLAVESPGTTGTGSEGSRYAL